MSAAAAAADVGRHLLLQAAVAASRACSCLDRMGRPDGPGRGSPASPRLCLLGGMASVLLVAVLGYMGYMLFAYISSDLCFTAVGPTRPRASRQVVKFLPTADVGPAGEVQRWAVPAGCVRLDMTRAARRAATARESSRSAAGGGGGRGWRGAWPSSPPSHPYDSKGNLVMTIYLMPMSKS